MVHCRCVGPARFLDYGMFWGGRIAACQILSSLTTVGKKSVEPYAGPIGMRGIPVAGTCSLLVGFGTMGGSGLCEINSGQKISSAVP